MAEDKTQTQAEVTNSSDTNGWDPDPTPKVVELPPLDSNLDSNTSESNQPAETVEDSVVPIEDTASTVDNNNVDVDDSMPETAPEASSTALDEPIATSSSSSVVPESNLDVETQPSTTAVVGNGEVTKDIPASTAADTDPDWNTPSETTSTSKEKEMPNVPYQKRKLASTDAQTEAEKPEKKLESTTIEEEEAEELKKLKKPVSIGEQLQNNITTIISIAFAVIIIAVNAFVGILVVSIVSSDATVDDANLETGLPELSDTYEYAKEEVLQRREDPQPIAPTSQDPFKLQQPI